MRFWNMIVPHSATGASSRVGTNIKQEGVVHSRRSSLSQNCSVGLRSGHCTGQSSSFASNLAYCLLECHFVHRGMIKIRQV